ncbi:DOPA 4,5-dioxygenase family protein [Rhodopila sp.]|uniref:DOPA 4,5-dioxygenase family protein n=1 Tax=Rhodopila sp. TaxID=2480087 RepID=UPI003D098432
MAPVDDVPVDLGRITDYHIHVYYDPASRRQAEVLREWVQTRFAVRMGRWHDVPVGPHPTAMYQIAFPVDLFPTLVPFVMMNRLGLTVLLHPQSGRPRDDHTINATWMGAVLPLNIGMLPEADQHA